MNKKELISKLEYALLLTFPILTTYNFITFNNTLKAAKIDSPIAVIYSSIIGLLAIIIYIYIFNYKPKLTLPEKNIYIFGKKIGTAINYILAFNASITGLIIINNTVNFIIIHYLKETPKILILIAIGLTIAYNSTKGIKIIARTSFIIFIIIAILTICSTIGLITKFNINNILPILEFGPKPIIQSGNKILLDNIVNIYILLTIPKASVEGNKNTSKYILLFYSISMITIFILTILTVGILGKNLINIYTHPEYIILKKISLFEFIDHIENIVYIKWIFNSFLTIILIIYYISNTIKIKKNNKYYPLIITISMILVTSSIFRDNTYINNYLLKNYHYLNIVSLSIFTLTFIKIYNNNKTKKEVN